MCDDRRSKSLSPLHTSTSTMTTEVHRLCFRTSLTQKLSFTKKAGRSTLSLSSQASRHTLHGTHLLSKKSISG